MRVRIRHGNSLPLAGHSITHAGGGVNGGVNGDVTGTQKSIMESIARNKFLSLADIALQIGKPKRTVENNVKKLKSMGVLVRVGADKNGHWRIVEPPAATGGTPKEGGAIR
jgi:predicted HTH transcriptional regulator